MRNSILQLALWLVAAPAFALTPGVIQKNNDAVKLLESEKNFEAYKTLTDGLAEAPFQVELHMNLGFAFEKNNDPDKAIAEYESVAKNSQDPAFKFQALFNAARLKGEQKKIDEALDLYQKALEIIPDSKETKTNIELLLASGGGGGKGDQNSDKKDKGDNGEGNNEQDKKKPPKPQGQGPKPTPRPFNSEELSKQDVKNILDELKRQENQVRSKEYEKKAKENTRGKDW